jgi:uncharacterized surface protein with fasciclin (FAS1) repeats
MAHRRHVTLAAAAGVAALLAFGAPSVARAQSIVEVAASAGQFNTLVGALRETGLADTLSGGGPYTVFAPTDAAFAELSDAEQRALLNPENRGQLENLLLFHVVEGEVPREAFDGLAVLVPTLYGDNLAIDGTVTPINVGGAPLADAGIEADNGLIHVVGEVIVPPELSR